MMSVLFKGKVLALKISATVLLLFFFVLEFYSPISNYLSTSLIAPTLVAFFVLDHILRKTRKDPNTKI